MRGSDPKVKDDQGRSPLEIAEVIYGPNTGDDEDNEDNEEIL